ncbi:MAG: hypothetical protein WB810_15525 [Candidatus Cybelea sp.]
MRVWDFSRCLFGISAAAAILAGCGGSQPSNGAPGGDAETLRVEPVWYAS